MMSDPLRIILDPATAAEVERQMKPGRVWIGKVGRETMDGTNVATAGRLILELGTAPESAMPALRECVRLAREGEVPVVTSEKPKRRAR